MGFGYWNCCDVNNNVHLLVYIVRSMKKMLYTEGQLHIPAEVAVVCTRARTVQR